MHDPEEEEYSQAAKELDAFYKDEKAVLKRAVDKIFRKGVKEGIDLTLQECKNVSGKKILYIGCGIERVPVELAKRGANMVCIDSSRRTLNMTELIMEKEGLRNKLTVINDDFATHAFNEKFNLSLALGFLDYTKDASFHIRKMKSLTTEKCIMSFSSKLAFQVPLRMIWLRSRNLPVYFYTKKELKRLLSNYFSHYKIKNVNAGYHCVGVV